MEKDYTPNKRIYNVSFYAAMYFVSKHNRSVRRETWSTHAYVVMSNDILKYIEYKDGTEEKYCPSKEDINAEDWAIDYGENI